MDVNRTMLLVAARKVQEYYNSGEWAEPFNERKLADIVLQHAAAAAVAAMAGGVLPGVAAIIASGIAVGAIWIMYYRIGRYLGMKFDKDILKALASAAISNLVTQAVGLFAIDVLMLCVPGYSIAVGGIVNFAVVYAAGLIYLKMLTEVFKKGNNPATMSAEDLKAAYTSAAKGVDIKSVCSEAKDTFKEMRKNGDLQKSADEADLNSVK